MSDPKPVIYLHWISIGLGLFGTIIIIKSYFENKDHNKVQKEIALMQKELLDYQLQEQRNKVGNNNNSNNSDQPQYQNFSTQYRPRLRMRDDYNKRA